MCVKTNPYTPGAGSMPPVLAGRETTLENAFNYLDNVQGGYPQQPVIYFGLRGVGKTVLLNSIENAADNKNMLYTHIEASEDGKFTTRLVTALVRFTNSISTKSTAENISKRCVSLIRSFRVTYNIIDNRLSLDANPDANESIGIYEDDLAEIVTTLGQAAKRTGDSICIFVDEMQYLSKEEIVGLVVALHRCNQLRLPVIFFGAGLPKIRKAVGEAKSYAERLFKFEEVDALTKEGAAHAISGPAENFGIKYSEDAIDTIFNITEGYPYFIQEFCSIVWNKEKGTVITKKDVQSAEPDFLTSLDKGFFSVRYDKCSNMEKAFMAAMVKCGELPCTISNVSTTMNRSVKSLSPFRGKLISKGLIYATGHAEIDFTVPQFDGFIRRINPELDTTI